MKRCVKGRKNIRAAGKPSKLRKNSRLIRRRLTAAVANSVVESTSPRFLLFEEAYPDSVCLLAIRISEPS